LIVIHRPDSTAWPLPSFFHTPSPFRQISPPSDSLIAKVLPYVWQADQEKGRQQETLHNADFWLKPTRQGNTDERN
jgi:hypothetical protein